MISNFNLIKSQLRELSTVINSFKSEAVQLLIVEIVLRGEYGGGSRRKENRPDPSGREQRVAGRDTAQKPRAKATRKRAPSRKRATA